MTIQTKLTKDENQYAQELAALDKAGNRFKPKGSILAGGALTSVFTGCAVNDFDLYFKNEKSFRDAVKEAYEKGFWCCEITSRAVTFSDQGTIIQLMHFDWFDNPRQIFDAFDFTCCMAGFDNDTKKFSFHENFMRHCSQRYLSFHSGTLFPFASLLRVLKYQSRGYTIGKSDLLRIALKCHSVEMSDWDDLLNQVGGYYSEKINLNKKGAFSTQAAIESLEKSSGELTSTKRENYPLNASALLSEIFGKAVQS